MPHVAVLGSAVVVTDSAFSAPPYGHQSYSIASGSGGSFGQQRSGTSRRQGSETSRGQVF